MILAEGPARSPGHVHGVAPFSGPPDARRVLQQSDLSIDRTRTATAAVDQQWAGRLALVRDRIRAAHSLQNRAPNPIRRLTGGGERGTRTQSQVQSTSAHQR